MATLTINSAAIVAPLMSYDDYYVDSPRPNCGVGATSNGVSFNATGGYRTGVNFSGTFPAATLRILSYIDLMVEIEPGEPEVLLGGFTPSVLEDSGGTPLTYPHDEPITSPSMSSMGITQTLASPEVLCPTILPTNIVQRRRILTYQIIDTMGNVGPTRTARLDLTHTP